MPVTQSTSPWRRRSTASPSRPPATSSSRAARSRTATPNTSSPHAAARPKPSAKRGHRLIGRNVAARSGTAARRLRCRAINQREMAMDWNRIEGNWKQFKGSAKEKWGKLTDDDLNVIEGRREQLEGRLQQRYGFAKDQIHKDVDDWFRTLK